MGQVQLLHPSRRPSAKSSELKETQRKHRRTSAFGREVPRTCEMVSVQIWLGLFGSLSKHHSNPRVSRRDQELQYFAKGCATSCLPNLRTTCIQVLARLSSESGPVPSSLIHIHASSIILFHSQHQRRSKISIAGKPAPCILNA